MPDLVPVEDNPFHVKLVPTDEQPDFADSLQGNFGTASQQLLNQEAQRRGVVGNVLQHFTLPGRIAQGVQNLPGEDPNVMTEEKAFRLNQQNNEAMDWAHSQALNSISSGMPMAERMALGTSGGGIKAYHGSPYDFEKFDIGKIGTGEGHQAYGSGLYFSKRPETAKSYRDALSNTSQTPAQSIAEEYFRRANNDPLVAQKLLGEHVDMFGAKGQEAMDILKSGKGLHPGRMYEVNINADPEHFLDWDKPLSEQPPVVQDLARNADLSHLAPGNRTRRQIEMWREGTLPNKESEPTGNVLHSALTDYGTNTASNADLTMKLREAGIPGIKYLDQGSRNTNQFRVSTEYRPEGDQYHVFDQKNKAHGTFDTKEAANAFAEQKNTEGQTHNYVVFHHDIIDILKKYGLAGLIGAGAAHFKTTPVDNNPFTAQQ